MKFTSSTQQWHACFAQWPGYREAASQFQLRHQRSERPITLCDLVRLVGRAVDRFFNVRPHHIEIMVALT